MVKLLGAIDIVAAFIIALGIWGYGAPLWLYITIGLFLFGKFLMSVYNYFGWIDLIILIVIIVGILIPLNNYFLIIALVALIKGLTSVAA